MANRLLVGLAVAALAAARWAFAAEAPAPAPTPTPPAPAALPPEMADVDPESEKGRALRRMPVRVSVRKTGGSPVAGPLISYEAGTGVLVVASSQILDKDVEGVEFHGVLKLPETFNREAFKALFMRGRRVEANREEARRDLETALEEVEALKAPEEAKKYLADHEDRLKNAPDARAGWQEILRVSLVQGIKLGASREAIAQRLTAAAAETRHPAVQFELRAVAERLREREEKPPPPVWGRRDKPGDRPAKGPGAGAAPGAGGP